MKGNDPPDNLQKSPRRRILRLSAGALATGLAGCLGGTDDGSEPTSTETSTPSQTETDTPSPASVRHEQVDPFTELNRTETRSTTTLSFEVLLEAGQFAHQELRIEQPSEIHITGESTAEMDVFLLAGESAFSKYQAGERAIFSGGFTATDTTEIDRIVAVSAGRYFAVFDNSSVYGADPEGEVNSTFEIVVSSNASTPTGTETPTETETATPRGENNAETVSESDMPKIRKVTDNFGHTFVWDPDEYHSDDTYSTSVDDNIIVSDETKVALTVEEIWANPDDDITFSYVFGSSRRSHPDNTGFTEKVRSNEHTWDMKREDYTSEWRFQVYLRNEDTIDFYNDGNDFAFTLHYTNLELE